jgi:hypothetical protein
MVEDAGSKELDCKLQIGDCKLQIGKVDLLNRQFAFCNLQFAMIRSGHARSPAFLEKPGFGRHGRNGMPLVIAEETRTIGAPAGVVYDLLADYRVGHPSILPPAFIDLVVDEGGYGAGTRIHFDATLLGRRDQLTAVIEEPEPGRVLIERYPDRGMATTFTIEPDAANCRVTIRTEIEATPVSAFFQRLFVPALLRRIFREELVNIEREVSQKPGFS